MSTLYVKRGKKYVPVAEHTTYDHLTEGHYLVRVQPGMRSMYRVVEPDHISLIAAAKDALDAMCQAMREAAEYKPKTGKPLTKRQREAWEQLNKVLKVDRLEGASANDIVEAGLKALVDAARKREEQRREQLQGAVNGLLERSGA